MAINGFGRIGRTFFRQAFDNAGVDIVAINDLGEPDNLAYLLRHDSVYGTFAVSVAAKENALEVGEKEVKFFQEKDPGKLPWKNLGVDVVIESTGVFTTTAKAKSHLDAGAKRVVITAPANDDQTLTTTPNVGAEKMEQSRITSNASCTTNATTPVVTILMRDPGIEQALLSTIHGYTATQNIVDGPHGKDWLRGRAAAVNIVPSTTGAAVATEKAIPGIKGKFDGVAIRVPVISGSVIDFTFIASRKTSRDEINDIFRKAADDPFWKEIFTVSEEPLVSTDIIGSSYGSIVDLNFTRVVGGNLVKVLSWYDNEWGYCAMLLKHVLSLKPFLS